MADFSFQKDLDKVLTDYNEEMNKILNFTNTKQATHTKIEDQNKISQLKKKLAAYLQKIHGRR